MILILILSLVSVRNANIYESLKTEVMNINNRNWTSKVKKGIQNDQIFIIHFYTNDDGKSY